MSLAGTLFGAQPQGTAAAAAATPAPAASAAGTLFGSGGGGGGGSLFGGGLFGSSAPTPAPPPAPPNPLNFQQQNSTMPSSSSSSLASGMGMGMGMGTNSLFSTPAANPFGTTSSSLFPNRQQQQQQQPNLFSNSISFPQQQQQQAPQQPQIVDYMNAMRENWNREHPNCQFRHYFYNIVHPSEVQYYTRPANHDQALWDQAMQDNPDPSCMVPVLATGFEDIKKRIDSQSQACRQHLYKLSEAATRLEAVKRKHHLDTLIRLEEFKRRELEFFHRVLKLLKTSHILHKKSYPITPAEESQFSKLAQLSIILNKPSMFRGKVNELSALSELIKEGKGGAGGVNGSAISSWGVVDPEGLRNVFSALSETQVGLAHLTQVMQKDKKDIGLMGKGYGDRK